MDAAVFKQLVSGEPVEARLPYGKPFTLTWYAKLIFNCNELPKDVEQTEAYFRRFLIIPFEVTIAVLAELKHPRRTATFIAQQNNAINQQVNNAAKADLEQFENSEKVANELIAEDTHGTETMDIRTTVEAILSHLAPKAVGTCNRAQNK